MHFPANHSPCIQHSPHCLSVDESGQFFVATGFHVWIFHRDFVILSQEVPHLCLYYAHLLPQSPELNDCNHSTKPGWVFFCFFVLVTLSGAECTKLELVFDLHSLYTFPITTLANVIVAILNIQIIMSCVAQAETPLLLCIIITITLIVYTKENHATIAPPASTPSLVLTMCNM